MNPVRNTSRSAVRTLLCLLCLIASGPAAALELELVLGNVTVHPPARVGFREERHNEMLKEPLVLTGYLEYLDEERLRKVVETPFQEALLIDADRIEIERDGETRSLPLRKNRFLRTMLGGIKAILAGQVEQIVDVFSYEVAGTEADWSIVLKPLSRRVSRQVKSLVVTGDDESLTSIRFDIEGGEWHHMEILRPGS